MMFDYMIMRLSGATRLWDTTKYGNHGPKRPNDLKSQKEYYKRCADTKGTAEAEGRSGCIERAYVGGVTLSFMWHPLASMPTELLQKYMSESLGSPDLFIATNGAWETGVSTMQSNAFNLQCSALLM